MRHSNYSRSSAVGVPVRVWQVRNSSDFKQEGYGYQVLLRFFI